jgi:hypothetical protein
MTLTAALDIPLGIALLAYVSRRQLRWRPVDTTRIWRMPLVLGVVGLFATGRHAGVTTVDLAILVLSGVLAVGSGFTMGSLTRFRPITGTHTPLRNGVRPTLESRVGWAGVGLWAGLIAGRIGLDVVGLHFGAALATSTGAILLSLALNRAARALVFSARLDRHVTAAA